MGMEALDCKYCALPTLVDQGSCNIRNVVAPAMAYAAARRKL